MNLSNWQASSYLRAQKPHQLGTGPVSSQNLPVGMNSLICIDPYQIWLRKWTGVCKTSYRPVCSAWYQTRHEHHCQKTVGLPLLGGDSALMMSDICRYQMSGGFYILILHGREIRKLDRLFLSFYGFLFSLTATKGIPMNTNTALLVVLVSHFQVAVEWSFN